MKIYSTEFEDVKVIENFFAFDIRGKFIKTYNDELFRELGIDVELKETYYSLSQQDVIRGMHFQMPPYEHDKIIHVIQGKVVDVVLDLRKESKTYKQFIDIKLTGNKPKSIYIPKGFAHGFKCMEDNTIMLYQVSTGYNAQHDAGIAYDSIGYDWGIDDPIVSERDRTFPTLSEFDSPF